ncbi:MAG: hypothetical protein AB7K09_15315 [Planctomycetota bacterium]
MPAPPMTADARAELRNRLIDLLTALQEVLDEIAPDADRDAGTRVLPPVVPFAEVTD